MKDSKEKNNFDMDYKGLEEMGSNALSVIPNVKVNSELLSAKENLVSSCARAEHAQELLKESIKDLLQVEEEERANLDDLRAQTMGLQASRLLSQISQAGRNKNELEKEIEFLVVGCGQKEQLEKQLKEREETSSRNVSSAVPKVRADVNTYSKISGLKWDFGAPDDVVKGFIVRPEKNDIVPFKFDRSSHSQFFITNFLWEQFPSDSFL